MSDDAKKVLLVCDEVGHDEKLCSFLRDNFEVVEARSPLDALALLARDSFAGVCIVSDHRADASQLGKLFQSEQILEGMPDGVALLDSENQILWSNRRLCQWTGQESVVGKNFYSVLSSPEILGPDFCPFHTALSTGKTTHSTLRAGEHRYYQIHAAPVLDTTDSQTLLVVIRDVTAEILQQQKLEAIHKAGMQLADLKPEEVVHMSVEERIELLKSNILHYTKDLLNFDVVEIRLLDQKTGKLEPLLSVGMEEEAEQRTLFAQPQHYGVTGFVAATGKSYLCEDTAEDPLYLTGAKGAKSSLTVPLILHDEVLGTFNVESPEAQAFSESDLQFLEIFSRDVAVALNTLELLVAEKTGTALESVEAIHTAVALPIDDILNEAVNIMERYIGHDPDVVTRLESIVRNARDIKLMIQRVGQKMTLAEAVPLGQGEPRPRLSGKRVLVADADESVRSAAHSLLERYGCVVETAHDGSETLYMVRNLEALGGYDCIIADIRLADLNGFELMIKLREINAEVPLVLMTGYGYDPGHSIVKARQAGLKEVLYKPFRLDLLLESVERVTRAAGSVANS